MDLRNLAFRVQFEGDESFIVKTDKAMDELKESISGATSELSDMGESLKDSTNTKPIEQLDKKTKGLKDNFKNVAQSISANIKYAKGDVDKLGKSIKEGMDTKPISKFSTAFIDAGHSIASVTDKVTKHLDKINKKISDTGKKLTKKITTPIIGLGIAGTKMAFDLEHSIKKVTTLADSKILPAGKIQEEVRAISDASGIAETEVAEAAYSALSAGVDSSNVMEFVRSGIDLTRAGFTDMETAIDATTTVLNAYGDKAYDVSKIHDIFVQTQDKGKISVDELGKNIGRVIPTASSLGVNLDQLGASYAILTAKGQNAQLATTNLNAMLAEMGSTGSKVDEALRKMSNKSFAQLTEEGKSVGEVLGIVDEYAKKNNLSLKDMFGSMNAGSAAVTLLSEGVEGYNKMLGEMDNSTGKTAANAETMEDGLFKIQKAMTQAKNALIDVGAMLAPYIEVGAEKISILVEKFNSLDEGTKMNIMRFAGLAAAIGPVLMGTGELIGATSNVIGIGGKLVGRIFEVVGILGGPLTLVLAGAVVAGVALYKNWDTIKEGASRAWGATTKIVEGAVSKIKGFWQGLKDFMKNPIKGVVNIFKRDKGEVSKVDGSHATGLGKVPWNGYIAELHKGEEVLTADDPRNINNYKTTNTSNIQTTTSKPNVVYNPTFNITVGEGTTEKEKVDLERRMKQAARESFEEFFYELGLQIS